MHLMKLMNTKGKNHKEERDYGKQPWISLASQKLYIVKVEGQIRNETTFTNVEINA